MSKNLSILADVLRQKPQAERAGKDAKILPAESLETSDRDDALIYAFISKYGAQGLLLLQDAQARAYSIGAESLGVWNFYSRCYSVEPEALGVRNSYSIDENDKTIAISM